MCYHLLDQAGTGEKAEVVCDEGFALAGHTRDEDECSDCLGGIVKGKRSPRWADKPG